MTIVEKILLFHIAFLVLAGVLVILIKGWRSTKQYFKLFFSRKEIPKPSGQKTGLGSDVSEERPIREPEHWIMVRPVSELREIRQYIIKELMKMKNTDWGSYALRFVLSHSPKLANLMVNDEVNIEFIKNEETQGIKDTIDVIQRVDIKENVSLRDYFRDIFQAVSKSFPFDVERKFYYYGRDRVLDLLRLYKASESSFPAAHGKKADPPGLETTGDTVIDSEIVVKIRKAMEYADQTAKKPPTMEEVRDYFRFSYTTDQPLIEFDLDRIKKVGNFKYQGSLVNSLYLELKRLHKIFQESEPFDYYYCDPLYDFVASFISIGLGTLVILKYKGSVEYFPNRLFIRFDDLDCDHWSYKWVRSYKMFLEGND
jgi:hypothetical protein